MQEKRIFTGGINNDLAFEFLKEDEYRYALNMIIGASDNDDSELINRTGIGHGENIKGNTEITNIDIPLPHNDFKVVGAYEDQLSNSVFYFVSDVRTDDNNKFTHIVDDRECFLFDYNIWNDNGYDTKLSCDKYLDDAGHRILRYWAGEKRIETILISKWLNFSPEFLITGINLVLKEYGDGDNTEGTERQELLYWTDMFNPPRKLNVQKALYFMQSNGLSPKGYNQLNDVNTSRVLDKNDVEWVRILDAVKYPPRFSPDIKKETDYTYERNFLKNKYFQYSYRYVYDDYEKSAISPFSEILLRSDNGFFSLDNTNNFDYNTTTNFENKVVISFDTGNSSVEKIELFLRDTNNGDIYMFDSLDKDLFNIKDNDTFKYNFYNNKILYPVEKDNNGNGYKLFDNLPLIAKSQEIINNNRLIYGNIIEGYDANINVDIDFSLIKNKPIDNNLDLFFETGIENSEPIFPVGANGTYSYCRTVLIYSSEVDDGRILFYFDNKYSLSVQYLVKQSEIDTIGVLGILNNFANEIKEQYNILMLNIYNCVKQLSPAVRDLMLGIPNISFEDFYNTTIEIEPLNYTDINGNIIRTDYNIKICLNFDNGTLTRILLPGGTGAINCFFKYSVYDSVAIDEIFDDNVSSGLTYPANLYTGFKSGATHSFGIVYYDRANRSTTVLRDINNQQLYQFQNDKMDIYIPFFTEESNNGIYETTYNHIKWELKHEPPCWATHYQFVYTGSREIKKFIQFTIFSATKIDNTIKNGADGSEWEISLKSIKDYKDNMFNNSILTYSFTNGDLLRIITSFPYNNYIQEYIEVEVTGFNSGTNMLTVRSLSGLSFNPTSGSLVEIYTPRLTSEENSVVFYEFSQEYGIYTDPITCKRYHKGELIDQSPSSNAEGIFKRGDVYVRQRYMPTADTSIGQATRNKLIWIEDFNWSDFYISDYWDKGRPNLIGHNSTNIQGNDDFRRVHRPATIYFSGSFVPSTNINGLSSFPDLSYNDYEVSKGSIQLLKTRDRSVICFQELRVGVIPINERLSHTTTGTITAQNDTVLNEIDYYAGDFGIGIHPESFASFGYQYYFLDVYRGVVLRLSQDGLTPLSTLYGIENITTKTFSTIKNFEQKNNLKVNIYGVYNRKFNQYEFSVEDTIVNEENSQLRLYSDIFKNVNQPRYYTLAFSERANKFTSFMSYLPEYFSTINQDLLSFKNGRLYLHGSNNEYNTFYGVHTPSEIWVVANAMPSNIKIAEAFSQENNVLQYNDKTKLWEVYELYNNQGQDTNLIRDDFEFDESIWYAPFWKDTNTPNVSEPLVNGDEIRSNYILLKINNDSKELCRLFAVNIQWINSDRHNV